jgi:SAM-dependent methyltransferase
MNKKEYYEWKADSYTEFDRQGFARYQRALKLANIQSGTKVLDIGCKHAFLCDYLEERGMNCDYYGLDISEKVIESVKHKKGTFQTCDIMKGLPFDDGKFDYIFCLEVLEHIENPTFLLNQFNRVLNDDGVLLLSVPNPYEWTGILAELFGSSDTEGHIVSFALQNIRKILDFCGLKVEKRLGTYAMLPYTPHGIRKGRYLMFPTSLTFLACSFVYRIRKRSRSD